MFELMKCDGRRGEITGWSEVDEYEKMEKLSCNDEQKELTFTFFHS